MSQSASQNVVDPRRGERGLAVGEMLLMTLPLCVLCMAMTSRFQVTSSRRMAALQDANVRTQVAARGEEGGHLEVLDTGVIVGGLLLSDKVRKSAPLQIVPGLTPDWSLLKGLGILPVYSQHISASIPPRSYHFSRIATDLLPEPAEQQAMRAGAFYINNEPNHVDTKRRWTYGLMLFGFGMWQARELLGGGGGSGPHPEEPGKGSGDKGRLGRFGDKLNPATDAMDKLGGAGSVFGPGGDNR